ncbi:hypothetical protein KC950_04365 [Candidatus Saccharibacteria bacterium]|nr:hypothetical protein [Candidatus Saccharibacteria bacterium]
MEIRKHFERNAGTYGWIGLIGYVALFDIYAPETMSSAADRALEHPIMKYVALGAAAITTAHVINAFDAYDIPDPIQKINEKIEQWKDTGIN